MAKGNENETPTLSIVKGFQVSFKAVVGAVDKLAKAVDKRNKAIEAVRESKDLGIIAHNVAGHIRAVLAERCAPALNLSREAVESIVEGEKEAFNFLAYGHLAGKGARRSVQSTLSQIWRVVLSPVTGDTFAPVWAEVVEGSESGGYGSEVNKVAMTLGAGLKAIREAKAKAEAAKAPEVRDTETLERAARRLLSGAADKRTATLAMVTAARALADKLEREVTPAQPVAAAQQA